ncbi:MAG: CYTH domain-containing protein [Clostridia bacterium]|nr:CYTH domain-containing protein [Clostridia bacterium]
MENKPLEIEYKFLIEMPCLKTLEAQPEFKAKKLCQMYLELPEGLSEFGRRCRIRKIEENGKLTYCKTFKKDVTGITRIEVEEEISEEEFNTLSKFLKAGTAPIEKTRYTFFYEGYTCEVDIFPFWKDKAFLEIEVESESITPPIPPFINIIRDVSTDKMYRNSVLAQMIFQGTII